MQRGPGSLPDLERPVHFSFGRSVRMAWRQKYTCAQEEIHPG
jgi:hypothetical protein